jgi:hypothetical protein
LYVFVFIFSYAYLFPLFLVLKFIIQAMREKSLTTGKSFGVTAIGM